MAFDPLDWIRVADQLLDDPDEAALRTAIGRMYYAVWLGALLQLESTGRYLRRGFGDDHSGVIRTTKQTRHSAGVALENLRRLRETADYESAVTVTAADAARARELSAAVRRAMGLGAG